MATRSKPTFKEGGFAFYDEDDLIAVYYRKLYIGKLRTSYTASDRHCFVLACDESDNPQEFRGRLVAGKALLKLHRILLKGQKMKWATRQMVIEAWKDKPVTAR